MTELNRVDLGSVRIHKQVIAQLAFMAIQEVAGASPIPKDFLCHLKELAGTPCYPGVDVTIDGNHQVMIDVSILVQFGDNIPEVARQVQQMIRETIEKTVEIDLKDVHVNIHGIERRKP
ncbi:MAG: Asp23/Gls24 family envelope stress response protein [Candidatus Omnitrophica bacterium]|nr:Asp23/Gls24 family envelope stress response protein [Candidatus Omnitrophota bacterium]